MITIRKLSTLRRGTALRKTASLLQGFELDLKSGKSADPGYIRELFRLLLSGKDLIPTDRDRITVYADELHGPVDGGRLIRVCNDVRHRILKHLGTEPADWDLTEVAGAGKTGQIGQAGIAGRHVLPVAVYLDDIRSPFNVGAIFRTAESFGVSEIILSEACPSPDHPRARRSAMGCTDIVPWRTAALADLDSFENVFALETGGDDIGSFIFPAQGIAIIGSEELGISPEARERAAAGAGMVSISTCGLKGSLNVSAAFAIMMHAWQLKLRG